jgi:urease accessory protein
MAEFSGHLSLHAARRDHGRTVLAAQSFRAPFHISKPYWDADAGALLVQVVNPTAGILAGDRLESRIVVDHDAALLVTTPSASRVFRMRDGAAECRQHFGVGAGGWLEVMPEPLVPHRGSRYRQVTTVDVEAGGILFFVDQLMPGRIGHDETWAWDRLQLELSVRAAGDLVLRERFDHRGDELRELAALCGSGSAACFANAILIDPGLVAPPAATSSSAPAWQEAVNRLHTTDCWISASALRHSGWSIKLVARGPIALRAAVRQIREALAAYFPRLRCETRKL